MYDTLTHFIANNVILTFIVLVVIVMGFRSGFGAARKLVFLIVLAVLVLVLVPSCGQYVSTQWKDWNQSIAAVLPKYVVTGLCKLGDIDDACSILDSGGAAATSVQRRMLCIEDKLAADAANGGAAVKAKCGLRGNDTGAWEACVDLEAKKYEILEADLLHCKANDTSLWTQLGHDLFEPIACAFGTASCTTGSGAPQPYVYHRPYLQCLTDTANANGLDATRCQTIKDPQQWDACMVGVIRTSLSNADAWLARCEQIRNTQPAI